MNSSSINWYTLYTKQGLEKKVVSILSRKNIDNYCPLNKVKPQLNEWKRIAIEPLLPSYVFVRISENELSTVCMIDAVINIVHWLGKPAIVSEEEIEVMKRFMNEYENVKIQKIPLNISNTAPHIVENTGHVIVIKNNSIKITLPSLGYMMFAELKKSNIEVIAANNQAYQVSEKYRFAV